MTSSATPTYALRLQQHADSDDLWYVFTITRDGFRHDFGHDLDERVARALHADLSKLSRGTMAWLAGDFDEAKVCLLPGPDVPATRAP